MTTRRTYILACLLIVAAFCRADSIGSDALTVPQYQAELDRLLAVTEKLDSSGSATPSSLRALPQSWHVHTDQRDFNISTEGLQRDVRAYDSEKSAANAIAIRTRLQSLRREIDGFEKPPEDLSRSRGELNSILSRPEFEDVHGPTWLDRMRQRLLEWLVRVIERIFRSAAIPSISKYFVYGLMALALGALLYVAYRMIWRHRESSEVVPHEIAVSAKDWSIWLSEARAAAARGEWREAIHLAYWSGISFLERQGFWKPDRARTPREYLRLLSASSSHRETLVALTRIFELAWYAKRDADEGTFSRTLAELEKLGCH